jgi:cell shape-determining protein MreC
MPGGRPRVYSPEEAASRKRLRKAKDQTERYHRYMAELKQLREENERLRALVESAGMTAEEVRA